MKHPKNKLFFIALLLFFLVSCKKQAYRYVYPTLSDGRYDSEFPYKNCSSQLKQITNTITKLYCIAKYETYLFDYDEGVTGKNIHKKIQEKKYRKNHVSSESVAGTAILIHYDNNRVAFLTCAHIINFPDTLLSYHHKKFSFSDDYIHSASIKKSQTIFSQDVPGDKKLEILCMDKQNDIALLGKAIEESKSQKRIFDYPLGDSKSLEWGSFTYIIGYPIGRQMITKGIVSNPDFNEKGSFMIDALFNEGFSGGAILAVKDGVPNFELVGIAKSVAVTHENILKPEKESHEYVYNPNTPYEGQTYVKLRKKINYGVTYAVSTSLIKDFYDQNKKNLEEKGYYLDHFFYPQKFNAK
jgi:hypothetical protein